MTVRRVSLSAAWAASALALVPACASANVSPAAHEAPVLDTASIQDLAVSLDAFGRPSVDGMDISQLVGGSHGVKKLADVNVKGCTTNNNCGPS
jgi:hypothetical protein